MSTEITTRPRIYVACLSAYNNGFLHGRWIDVSEGEEYVRSEIANMLSESPENDAEEYAIHDYEGFEDYRVEEWSDISKLCEICELIKTYSDDFPSNIITYLINDFGTESVNEWIEDHYAGCYEDIEDYSTQYLEDTGALSGLDKSLLYYFDYHAYACDVELNCEMIFIEGNDGKCYVFHNY